MSVGDVRRSLESIVETLSGIPTHWKDQDRPHVSPSIRAQHLLSLEQWGTLFLDEIRTRTVTVDGATLIIYSVVGRRDFLAEVRCESFTQDDDKTAFGYLDVLMTKLRSAEGQALLNAANISLREFGASGATNINEPFDQRIRSVGVLELFMSTTICVEGEPSNEWIQKAIISSNLSGPGGVALPEPPNYNNQVIDGGV